MRRDYPDTRPQRAAAHQDAVLAALAKGEPTTARGVLRHGAHGLTEDLVRYALGHLVTAGLVAKVRGHGHHPWRWALTDAGRARAEALRVPDAPASETRRRLQGFMVSAYGIPHGETQRRDCARYDDCITAHAKHSSANAACRSADKEFPHGCRWWEPGETLRAVDYARTGLSAGAER